MKARTVVAIIAFLGVGLSSCGGGGGSSSPPPPPPPAGVSVTVSPGTANVPDGATKQFSASVKNTSNTAVTWEVNGTSGGNSSDGTISTSGLYTAPLFPPAGGTVTVSAVSQADNTKSGSASVTIQLSNASLAGTFAFDFGGNFVAGGSEVAVGSFVADGKGTLTSGVEYINSTGGILTNVPFTGTYTVGPDGRGSATITSASGTSNFEFHETTRGNLQKAEKCLVILLMLVHYLILLDLR